MTASRNLTPTDADLQAGPGRGALVLRGRRLEWGARTYLMGILNVTPDSFSGDGLAGDVRKAVAHGLQLIAAGADVLDIGGESTRPGAEPVPAEVEVERVVPVIRALRHHTDVPISIDTYKAAVAEKALEAGADLVNDVWALERDPLLADLIAERGVPVVLMDNRSDRRVVAVREGIGSYFEAQSRGDVVAEVVSRLQARILAALAAGIAPQAIIVDPGIGFGKSRDENLELIDRLTEVRALGYPVLCGPSRKSFIGLTLDAGPADRLEGTMAAVAVAIVRGADIVRVHDVAPIARLVRVTDALVRRGVGQSVARPAAPGRRWPID